ncbi:hypothetical protein GQS_09410 [Thermococcus sp. 4557]|nr:hypothetical protein GQS_09410 [Thermococcus sp. 4557]
MALYEYFMRVTLPLVIVRSALKEMVLGKTISSIPGVSDSEHALEVILEGEGLELEEVSGVPKHPLETTIPMINVTITIAQRTVLLTPGFPKVSKTI